MDEKKEFIQGEINARKSLLADSDYQMIKLVENMADCTTITQLVGVFKDFLTGFKDLVANRRKWRDEINAYEKELEDLNTDNGSIEE